MGVRSLDEANAMTLEEYAYRMRAYSFLRLDKLYDMHLQAWLQRAVKATKLKGKKEVPVYEKFEDFFDYDQHLNQIEGKEGVPQLTEQQIRMARIAERFNKEG